MELLLVLERDSSLDALQKSGLLDRKEGSEKASRVGTDCGGERRSGGLSPLVEVGKGGVEVQKEARVAVRDYGRKVGQCAGQDEERCGTDCS